HPQLTDLPRWLLARTLIVRDLATARGIAAHTSGYRFVTLQGELLEADGTLTVGTHHAETGILSRRSELRELREQVAQLDARLAEIERDRADLVQRIAQTDAEVNDAQQQIDVLIYQNTDLRERVAQHRLKRDQAYETFELNRSEMDQAEQNIALLESSLEEARSQAAEAEARVRALQQRMVETEQEITARSGQREQQQQEFHAAELALTRAEAQRNALREGVDKLDRELVRGRRELEQGEGRVAELQARLHESMAKMLAASSSLAHGYLNKEAAEGSHARLTEEHNQKRQEWEQRSQQAESRRQTWHARQEEVHAHEMRVNDLRHHLDTLLRRLREDYQISLRLSAEGERPEAIGPDEAVLPFVPIAEEQKPQTEEEIQELKRKLSRLGSVNMDALQELQDLELRLSTLQAQYDDLSAAERSLEEIISRINVDSRRLFRETLETVRGHFQELFRKLFGGGQADIVLEDETDILETGIEIIARPPGRELRSISLMSGGEKTLTAVALLLAIFRSKPSPFCILDEVDAALDEANITRLAAVLREFLDHSQFILVTHSKRTMATA